MPRTTYACDMCPGRDAVKNKSDHIRHLWRVHGIEPKERLFTCHSCGRDEFKNKSAFDRHECAGHSSKNKYMFCQTCRITKLGRNFDRRCKLKGHVGTAYNAMQHPQPASKRASSPTEQQEQELRESASEEVSLPTEEQEQELPQPAPTDQSFAGRVGLQDQLPLPTLSALNQANPPLPQMPQTEHIGSQFNNDYSWMERNESILNNYGFPAQMPAPISQNRGHEVSREICPVSAITTNSNNSMETALTSLHQKADGVPQLAPYAGVKLTGYLETHHWTLDKSLARLLLQ